MASNLIGRQSKYTTDRSKNAVTLFKNVRTFTDEELEQIQLGIENSARQANNLDRKEVFYEDFAHIKNQFYHPDGSPDTPKHKSTPFKLDVVAPVVFRYLRDVAGVHVWDYIYSVCRLPLYEVKNSLQHKFQNNFFVTSDRQFILKVLSRTEELSFFQEKFLIVYYQYQRKHPKNLLPKYFGAYIYHGREFVYKKTILVVNNPFPINFSIRKKYCLNGHDLGYTYTQTNELTFNTYLDQDFTTDYPKGFYLEEELYEALFSTLKRDCQFLRKMDQVKYSLMLGVHRVEVDDDKWRPRGVRYGPSDQVSVSRRRKDMEEKSLQERKATLFNRNLRLYTHATPMETILTDFKFEYEDDEVIPYSGLPARDQWSGKVWIYMVFTDVLAEQFDGKTSEETPADYYQFFVKFLHTHVFKIVEVAKDIDNVRRGRPRQISFSALWSKPVDSDSEIHQVTRRCHFAPPEEPDSPILMHEGELTDLEMGEDPQKKRRGGWFGRFFQNRLLGRIWSRISWSV